MRGISMAPPQSTQRTQRTEMSMPIAHTPSTLIPPAARLAAPGATGLEGNAVFDGERREKIFDFLRGAQRGRCARVRAWWGARDRMAGRGRGMPRPYFPAP